MSPNSGLAHTAQADGKPLFAAIYDRVSKDPGGFRRSVGRQDERNRAACAAHGWVLASDAVYCDNDSPASRFATKDRPDWKRLLKHLTGRRYHVLVLWEVSRGDRIDLGWLGCLHMCRDIGILIHLTSHDRTYDVRKRRDYKTLAEEGLDSADESEKTSERIRDDVARNALMGRPHGPIPYGYRREYEVDRHGKRRIVAQLADEAERSATGVDGTVSTYTRAGIVREIVRRLLAGESCRGVAADLNRRGIPSPRGSTDGWVGEVVRKLALNPVCAGFRRHRRLGVVAPGIWPALVSEADHRTLVVRFADPARRNQRDSSIKHLGSGLFVCGVCGGVARCIPREYGMAYTCRPKKPMARSAAEKRRAVTDAELEALRGLGRREQTARIVELVDDRVTQASVARGLGVLASTLCLRLKAERRRRGQQDLAESSAAEENGQPRSYHVTRCQQDVDDYVERAVWIRLSRPDITELLMEDTRADERAAALTTEITEKQARLDEARDSYASGAGLSLDGLVRIETRLEPEIKTARERLNEARIGPVLDGLLLPTTAEVRAEWRRRSLPQRRTVIRALIERVEILPLFDKKRFTVEESVRIVWRQPK